MAGSIICGILSKRGEIMLSNMYPFWAALIAMVTAQFCKPLYYWMLKREWKWGLMKASGGFPSSHSAAVCALALAVGI